ncbi:unnamed protein product [Parnassius apollo]|uniref:(apollo) hypothetical protein n=1 Tax=Parnassius apollo TaxID=110799 RepID=A0A8S3XN21_PARAO|nr:unnamed protein product [Parnassius apollo]
MIKINQALADAIGGSPVAVETVNPPAQLVKYVRKYDSGDWHDRLSDYKSLGCSDFFDDSDGLREDGLVDNDNRHGFDSFTKHMNGVGWLGKGME